MNCLFTYGGRSIGASASASVLPMSMKSTAKSSTMNSLNTFEHTSHEYIQRSQLLHPKLVLPLLISYKYLLGSFRLKATEKGVDINISFHKKKFSKIIIVLIISPLF